jgi:hypothetical protein
MARLPNGLMLVQALGVATSPGGFEPRGTVGFYLSDDCGETWTLASTLDPKYDLVGNYHHPTYQSGLDYPNMVVDPFRGTVYFIVHGWGVYQASSILFVSRDFARTWTPVVNPETGLSPLSVGLPFGMTTLGSGELVLFTCLGATPTLYVYSPTTGLLSGPKTFSGSGTCSSLVADHSYHVQRVTPIDSTEQFVRVVYPRVESLRQKLVVQDLKRFTDGHFEAWSTQLKLTATPPAGSLMSAVLIEPDYYELPQGSSGSRSLLYWHETTLSPAAPNDAADWGSTRIRALEMMGGVGGYSGPPITNVGTPWTGYDRPGDYVAGAFFFDEASHETGFLVHWLDASVIPPATNQDHPLRAAVVTSAVSTSITACIPGAPGKTCSATCPCPEGVGPCTPPAPGGVSPCAPGLVCGTTGVCTPAACSPNPKPVWDSEYCSETCRCVAGRGDCDSDAECLPGLACVRNNGGDFNQDTDYDVCVPIHCRNGVQDSDEAGIDCDGSCAAAGKSCHGAGPWAGECGASAKCGKNVAGCEEDAGCNDPSLACVGGVCTCRNQDPNANGSRDFCSAVCPCSEGRGGCDSTAECAAGLKCENRGKLYGMFESGVTNVCVPTATACDVAGTPGELTFCSSTCRCARGYGHCDSSTECLPGLTCAAGRGPAFGFAPNIAVCLPSHCQNGLQDSDEPWRDCGGRDCGRCDEPVGRPFTAATDLTQPIPLDVLRRTTWQWWETAWNSLGNFTNSWYSDEIPMYGDFDADGNIDLGFMRYPNSGGFHGRTTSLPVSLTGFALHDVPVPGRYDAGAGHDFGWWRPSTGFWFAKNVNSADVIPGGSFGPWGVQGDIPVTGNYDGDGANRTDFALFRPSTGEWWIKNQDFIQIGATTPCCGTTLSLGGPGDIPVAGDFDGDGRSDLVTFTPDAGNRVARWSGKTATGVVLFTDLPFGRTGDIPVSGDFDGDHVSDLAYYRPTTAQWFATDMAACYADTGGASPPTTPPSGTDGGFCPATLQSTWGEAYRPTPPR